jgi:sulfonate transport system substrate-binding protein
MPLRSRAKPDPADKSGIGELWYTRCPVPTASGLALDLGWLAKEFGRLDIKLTSVRDSPEADVRLAHYSHSLPGLFREGGNIPAIWARSSGQDTSVVALTWVDEYQAILTRPGLGILKPADLRGARVGIPQQAGRRIDFARAMALRGIVSALELGGLTTDDITIIDIASEQPSFVSGRHNGRFHEREAQALAVGEVDAIYVKGAPGRCSAREHGLITVVDLARHPDPLRRVNNGNPRPVTVDRRTAAERPDLVARYLSVLIRAAAWAEAHRSDVIDIVANEVCSSPADVEAAYGRDLNWSFWLDLSQQRRMALAMQKDFLLRRGFIENDFDVASWIDPRPLAQAHELLGGRWTVFPTSCIG